jgi:prepilin-type N-terminal cleavage/methylation domain-containing protein
MKNKGFTLVELVVTMVILGMVFSGVRGAYYMLLQTHDRVDLEREMQQELAFAVTRISDKIRAESVDYLAYTSGGNCQGLSLSGAEKICLGNNWAIEFDSTQEKILLENISGVAQPLFSENNFLVTEVGFYITPEKDPYDPAHLANPVYQLQPKVQIYLAIASVRRNKDDSGPLVQMDIQTTVSSRKYR